MEGYPIFDRYFAEEEAIFYKELFLENNLHPEIERPKEFFDVAIGSNHADLYFNVHLPKEEFAAADELIYKAVVNKGIPADYPLLDFPTKDLQEVIAQPDQWSKQDIAVARIILQERGDSVSYETVTEKAEERYDQLKQTHIKLPVLLILYALCCIGYVYTLIVGPMLYFFKHTDFNGKKQYFFSERTRHQGILLFIVNIICIMIWLMVLR